MAGMRIGVAFSGGLTPSDIVECVKLAETLGYESAWVAEGHGGDQFAILGACAAATRRIRLGTSISSVFVRSAPTIGMAAATVDQLSDGRFILGLGGSHRVQVEPEHGVPFVQPTARVRDTIAIVRALVQARPRLVSRRSRSRSSGSISGSGRCGRRSRSTLPRSSPGCWRSRASWRTACS
jgi:alkanesulfonate monooxygenase SsuD/methylene tetrahydromethanopterin reductase-like flavin-dependent oxidoreductase (luciferase family)